MITKQRLKDYRNREKELRGIEEVLLRIRSRIESPCMTTISGMPGKRSGVQDQMAENIAKAMDLMERYNQLWDELISMQREIENAINGLGDQTERTLMRLRYIEGKKWERICVDMNYGWDAVHRIHARALRNIV